MIKYFKGLQFLEVVQGQIHDEWMLVEKCVSGKRGTKSVMIDRRTLEITDDINVFNTMKIRDVNVLLVDEKGDIKDSFFSDDPELIKTFKKLNSRLITRK